MQMVLIFAILAISYASIPTVFGGVTLITEDKEVLWNGTIDEKIGKIIFEADQLTKINAAIEAKKKLFIEFNSPTKELILVPALQTNLTTQNPELKVLKKIIVQDKKKDIVLTGFIDPENKYFIVNVRDQQLKTLKNILATSNTPCLIASIKTTERTKEYILENVSVGAKFEDQKSVESKHSSDSIYQYYVHFTNDLGDPKT